MERREKKSLQFLFS